jgi:hypothetical protein
LEKVMLKSLAEANFSAWNGHSAAPSGTPAKLSTSRKQALVALVKITAEHIHWDRLMVYIVLWREGFTVNHKLVHRLWREEGLQRPTLIK